MRRRRQEGQMLVLGAMVLAFLFVPLGIYVIDSGLVEANYSQLSETLQASAEDGASMLDEAAVRADGTVRLDPVAAREVVDRSMRISQLRGLDSWTVTVQGQTVSVTAHLRVELFALGGTDLTQTRSARLAYGK